MKSFIWRELEVINRCLNIIGESIQGKEVIWYIDSKNVCRILEVGSRKLYLYEIVVIIFEKLQNLYIIFDIQWLLRVENI